MKKFIVINYYQHTLRDSLKAAKLVLVSTLLSRERDLLRRRGTRNDDEGATARSPLVASVVWSSTTISRLRVRVLRPNVGRDRRLDASRYLASSTLACEERQIFYRDAVFKCHYSSQSQQDQTARWTNLEVTLNVLRNRKRYWFM